jgi:hypothetical protein
MRPDFARLLDAARLWRQADAEGMKRPYDIDRLTGRQHAYRGFSEVCRQELGYRDAADLALVLEAWAAAVAEAPGPQAIAADRARASLEHAVGQITAAAEAVGLVVDRRAA